MPAVWDRIKAELATRQDARGREIAWLAQRLKCRVQVVQNWSTRGVPASRYAEIAQAMGWTIDRLTGAPPRPADWPFELLTKAQWDCLSERQRGAVEAAALRELRELEPAGEPLVVSAHPASRRSGNPHH
jgi:hypothetical protein